MKFLPTTKKQILLSSLIAVVVVAAATTGVYASRSKEIANNEIQAKAEVVNTNEISKSSILQPTTEEEVVTKPENTVVSAPVEPTPKSEAVIEQSAAVDTVLDRKCISTQELINTRFVNAKDQNGNPMYGDNAVILSELQRTNNAYYIFYQECVAAGKISSL